MIATATLTSLAHALGGNEDGESSKKLIDAFGAVCSLPGYQAWLREPNGAGTRFSLEADLGSSAIRKAKSILHCHRLLDGPLLEVLAYSFEGGVHLTDGPWVGAAERVYSYEDESVALCNYIVDRGYHANADVFLDPACGSGQHCRRLMTIPFKVALDINPRALVFCNLNASLAGNQNVFCGMNDLRKGLPPVLASIKFDNLLVAFNMPFAMFPDDTSHTHSPTQAGGERGAALTLAALAAVRDFAKRAGPENRLRIVASFNSLGRLSNGRWTWEVAEKARQIFPNTEIRIELMNEEKIWRINGVRTQKNPMPLEELSTRSRCLHAFPESQHSAWLGYERLKHAFQAEGFTHLGYAILDILVNK